MAWITGSGSAFPKDRLSSEELEQRLELEPGWIERRTGIRARRICAPDESTGSLAISAARRALASADIAASELDLTILATSTPDHPLPPTAFDLAYQLGSRAAAFDLAGACSGFALALAQAERAARDGQTVLVVAANTLSRRVLWSDRETAPLFGDGAGACVVVGSRPARGARILDCHAIVDGADRDAIWVRAGGSRETLDHDALDAGLHLMRLEHGAVPFRRAISLMAEVATTLLERADLNAEDIQHFLPHQANRSIVNAVAKRAGIASDIIRRNYQEFGNTSAATIPTLYDQLAETDQFQDGEHLLMAAAGAGLAAAGALLRWEIS